jgi:hypothetical protein
LCRPCHDTHATLTCLCRQRCRCLVRALSCRRTSLLRSCPTPQHITPEHARPSTRKPPSVSAPPQHTPMLSHNPRLVPTPPVLSPLLRRRESHAPPSHTPTHAELSHRHAQPSPGRTRLACTPARALPRPAAATPLPRRPRRTHRVPLAQVMMPRPCILPYLKSP